MPTLIPILVFFQALGAMVGAGAAVWAEMAYARAMRDGNVNLAERAHLRIIGRGLRTGMFLLLLSSLGLAGAAYYASLPPPALSTSYWLLMALALLIIGTSSALFRRRIPYALGSAVSFTAWWFLAYLTLGNMPGLSFGSALAFFAVAAALLYLLLRIAHALFVRA